MKFQNKKVIIFGGASGIGKACVEYFLQAGANVFCFDKDKMKLSEIENTDQLKTFYIDITSLENLKNILNNINEVDIVINCVGIYSRQNSITDFSEKEVKDTVETNLIGAIYISQLVTPLLIKSKGSILHISSSLGLVPEKESSIYCATKAGLNMFVKSLALQLANHGVRVNAVCPGPVATPLLENSFSDKKELEAYLLSRPLKRAGKPEEVASLVGFLSSEEASYITGGIYTIDGGESLM